MLKGASLRYLLRPDKSVLRRSKKASAGRQGEEIKDKSNIQE